MIKWIFTEKVLVDLLQGEDHYQHSAIASGIILLGRVHRTTQCTEYTFPSLVSATIQHLFNSTTLQYPR